MTQDWVCYIVECFDGTLYTGVTNDLKSRIQTHNDGLGAKYTKSRRPVTLLEKSGPLSRSEAQRLELKIKSLPRDQKVPALKGEKR